jgi:hypothetical protein
MKLYTVCIAVHCLKVFLLVLCHLSLGFRELALRAVACWVSWHTCCMLWFFYGLLVPGGGWELVQTFTRGNKTAAKRSQMRTSHHRVTIIALMMEALSTSETLVILYQTTRKTVIFIVLWTANITTLGWSSLYTPAASPAETVRGKWSLSLGKKGNAASPPYLLPYLFHLTAFLPSVSLSCVFISCSDAPLPLLTVLSGRKSAGRHPRHCQRKSKVSSRSSGRTHCLSVLPDEPHSYTTCSVVSNSKMKHL